MPCYYFIMCQITHTSLTIHTSSWHIVKYNRAIKDNKHCKPNSTEHLISNHRKRSHLKYLIKITRGTHIPAVCINGSTDRKHLPLSTSFAATLAAPNLTLASFANYRQLVVIDTKTEPLNPVSRWQIASFRQLFKMLARSRIWQKTFSFIFLA